MREAKGGRGKWGRESERGEKGREGSKEREGERESLFTIQTHLLILKLKLLASTLLTVTSDMLTLYIAPYSNSSDILILTLLILLILVVILQLLVRGGDTSEQ